MNETSLDFDTQRVSASLCFIIFVLEVMKSLGWDMLLYIALAS